MEQLPSIWYDQIRIRPDSAYSVFHGQRTAYVVFKNKSSVVLRLEWLDANQQWESEELHPNCNMVVETTCAQAVNETAEEQLGWYRVVCVPV